MSYKNPYFYGDEIKDSIINISNSPGEDTKPLLIILRTIVPNIYKLHIIWEHRENNKTDIWQAVTQFYLSLSDMNENRINKNDYFLSQNYPNPFNPTTKIKYSIPPVVNVNFASTTWVRLKVYNILGREVATLVNEEKPAGVYVITWDAKNLASGVYFYKIEAGNYIAAKKMVLIK